MFFLLVHALFSSYVQKPLLATLWHHHFCQLWQSRAVLFAIFGNLVQRFPYRGKSQFKIAEIGKSV